MSEPVLSTPVLHFSGISVNSGLSRGKGKIFNSNHLPEGRSKGNYTNNTNNGARPNSQTNPLKLFSHFQQL